MRSVFALVFAAFLSACATQNEPPKQAVAAAPAAAPAPVEKKAPQCWSGDANQFVAVGQKALISGVKVECQLTSDGKAAQWMGSK